MAPSTESPTPAPVSNLPLLIGLPLLIVVVTVFVVLLLLLLAFALRKWYKRRHPPYPNEYRRVKTEDPDRKQSTSPPKIRIIEPPTPSTSMQYVRTQVSDREHYIPHMSLPTSPERNYESKRPPGILKHVHRKDRHSRGRRNRSTSSGSLDSLLETVRNTEQAYSMSLSASSESSPEHVVSHMYMVPPEKLRAPTVAGEVDEKECIFITLLFSEDRHRLVVRIERVTGLPLRPDGKEVDAYIRLHLVTKSHALPQRPTSRTKLTRQDSAPVFDEDIAYESMSREELINSSLHLEVLDYRLHSKHRVLGRVELVLAQVAFENGQASLSLQLCPPKVRESIGTVLISLSYSPKIQKLGVIVLRAKDLNRGVSKEMDPLVKVKVTMARKVIAKLKTKRKSQSSSPIFNEALTCTVEPAAVREAIVTVTLLNESRSAVKREVGKVVLGMQSWDEALRHWSDMLAMPDKPIAEWHELR